MLPEVFFYWSVTPHHCIPEGGGGGLGVGIWNEVNREVWTCAYLSDMTTEMV